LVHLDRCFSLAKYPFCQFAHACHFSGIHACAYRSEVIRLSAEPSSSCNLYVFVVLSQQGVYVCRNVWNATRFDPL